MRVVRTFQNRVLSTTSRFRNRSPNNIIFSFILYRRLSLLHILTPTQRLSFHLNYSHVHTFVVLVSPSSNQEVYTLLTAVLTHIALIQKFNNDFFNIHTYYKTHNFKNSLTINVFNENKKIGRIKYFNIKLLQLYLPFTTYILVG